jgi:hypothetical protein
MDNKGIQSPLFERLTTEVDSYISKRIEISEGVFFSQHSVIKRLMKFKNRDLAGTKIDEDLRYIYYFDIISPRVDSEVKNLRFDTKNVMVFSRNPVKDFPAVFITNAKLKDWMMDNGEDEKLKAVVEEFSANGNVGFKKIKGGYEIIDPLNTYITNQKAETVNDTDIVERHEMTASQLVGMTEWEYVDEVIAELGDKSFTATNLSTPIATTGKRYEIFEFTGEVSEKEFNSCQGLPEGDEHKYFLAKVIVAGLRKGGKGACYTLFAQKLKGKMEDYYTYAHRGRYEGRFWRVGMYEMLFDHQIRANEIANDIASGLEWASKVIFRSKDSKVLQNIRADMDNGDVVLTEDLTQVDVRLHNLDQLIADWNRLMLDADRLSNSFEVVRGEGSGGTTLGEVQIRNDNAGKMFITLRQKITLPYRRVFREWVLPECVTYLKGQDIFRLVGDTDILDQFREITVNAWYMQNLVRIGPHTKAQAEAFKAEKLDSLRSVDPVIENSKEIWKEVLPRLFVTITGENSDVEEMVPDMLNMLQYETDPERINYMLDAIYKIRNIPIPPKKEQQAPDPLLAQNPDLQQQQGQQNGQQQVQQRQQRPMTQRPTPQPAKKSPGYKQRPVLE